MKRSVRQLTNKKIPSALPLVWKVFDEYEAVNYPTSGTQAFWNAIHDEGFLSQLSAYGAFDGEKLIGILALKNEGSHIALFFVDGAYHRQGVGRLLWDTFPAESDNKTAEAQTESGIQFVPMVFKKPKTEERK